MSAVGTPSRREMLGRLAVAVPLAGAAGTAAYLAPPASPPHPDAALLALGLELDAAWAAERTTWDRSDRWSEGDDLIAEAAVEASAAVVHRIEKVPARTLDGLLVKARAVSWCLCGEAFTPDEGASTDLQLAHAIVEDLRRIAANG